MNHHLSYPSLRFIKTRRVLAPRKEGLDNAGIDFFVPYDLTEAELAEKNPHRYYSLSCNGEGEVEAIHLLSHGRIVIPSGIKALIDPVDSMLQANNKSGVCTKKGLIYGAEVVDSSYTGEIHISLINTSTQPVTILPGEKIIQFIHVPVLHPQMHELSDEEFNNLASDWSLRGDNWQGSTDK